MKALLVFWFSLNVFAYDKPPIPVDGSGFTQPISGEVKANAGTNLNTSSLNQESTQLAISAKLPSIRQTFKASTIIPLVTAVTANVPFFSISGSATKTITVKKITVTGMTLTAVGNFAINVEKLSTTSTGGTSSVLVATPLDSDNVAATAVIRAYTAIPVKGALVGTVDSCRRLWQATTAAAAGKSDECSFIYGNIVGSGGLVLRGVAQSIVLTYPVVLTSAGTLAITAEWTEE